MNRIRGEAKKVIFLLLLFSTRGVNAGPLRKNNFFFWFLSSSGEGGGRSLLVVFTKIITFLRLNLREERGKENDKRREDNQI